MKITALTSATALLLAPFAHATGGPAAQVLSDKQRNLALLAIHTATGNQSALKVALNLALDSGLTVNEARDATAQLYAYCGFPRSLNALAVLMETVDERRAAGLSVTEGRAATPVPAGTDMLAVGTNTQTRLIGVEVKGPLYDFAPDIDRYLKAHLFGAIFASDVLNWQEREVLTIAALGSMTGTESQFAGHKNIGRHNGLTEAQIAAIEDLIEQNR